MTEKIEKKIADTVLHINYGIIKKADFAKAMQGIGFTGTDVEFTKAFDKLAERVKLNNNILKAKVAKKVKK